MDRSTSGSSCALRDGWPSSDQSAPPDRRFEYFTGDRSESLELIQERKRLLQANYKAVLIVGKLRRQTRQLQRELTEAEMQNARERLHVIQLTAENQDLEMCYYEYRSELQRLLAAEHHRPLAWVSPHGHGASQALRKAREQVEEENLEYSQRISAFTEQHESNKLTSDETVHVLGVELQKALGELQVDSEYFADLLEACTELHFKHFIQERQYAEEILSLKARNAELSYWVNSGLWSETRQSVAEAEPNVVASAKAPHNRRNHDRCSRTESERAEKLAGEIWALKSKCAKQRRKRGILLERLRADLSMVGKKLSLLGRKAEELGGNV